MAEEGEGEGEVCCAMNERENKCCVRGCVERDFFLRTKVTLLGGGSGYNNKIVRELIEKS
jgi:hypothetical protein